MTRIQFILKHRDYPYSCDPPYSDGYLSSGLFNSARLVQEMLRDVLGYETRIDHALDNNKIDKLVHDYRPDIVVIEAYWVVPEKFAVLTKLHPNVTWVVRNHSPMPFASNESIVVDWSLRYMDYPKVVLACNDDRADKSFRELISIYKNWDDFLLQNRCVYLPNYYPVHFNPRPPREDDGTVRIGCFGAIRPLKNQLMQAVAAIEYAELANVKLEFHINGSRVEGRGDAILKNIRHLFEHVHIRHELVEHPWLKHDEFVKLIRQMDVGLQVSYSESFNIVSADMAVNGVPIVVSSEIRWVDPQFQVDPNDSSGIARAIRRAVKANEESTVNHGTINALHAYDMTSIKLWKDFIESVV